MSTPAGPATGDAPVLAGLGPLGAWRTGVVAEFDDERGLGTLSGDDGTRVVFHCVTIADGSRTIAVGARVRYVLGLGPLGVLEGRDVTAAG